MNTLVENDVGSEYEYFISIFDRNGGVLGFYKDTNHIPVPLFYATSFLSFDRVKLVYDKVLLNNPVNFIHGIVSIDKKNLPPRTERY